MEKKKVFSEKLESFFAGKGFYIVLFLCVSVIGLSAWTMLSGGLGEGEIADDGFTLSEPIYDTAEEEILPAAETESEEALLPEAAPVINMDEEEPIAQVAQVTPSPANTAGAVPQPAKEIIPTYFIRPVAGEIENSYSMDALQYNRTMRDWRTHDGVDIATELGAQVKACADGTVEKVYADDAMGTTVVLKHSGGMRSIYANLAETPTVKEGEAVAGGSVIGSVGNTALGETGEVNHLHFAMSIDGKSVDPQNYLP